jgi:hypothetical protein
MYLARAIRANSSLRSSELDYKTDERVYSYFVGSGAGNGQALGHDFSVSATALGWLIVLVALFTAVRTVLMDKATEKGVERWEEKFPEAVEEARSRLRKMLRRGKSPESEGEEPPAEAPGEEGEPAGAAGPEAVEAEAAPAPVESETPTEDEQTNSKGWLPWLVTIPPLVVVVAILAHRASPGTEVATAALALAATAVALVTHEVGHMLGARAVKARLKRTYWTPGVPLALAMAFIPLEMNLGPYVGHEVEGEMKETQTWWVYCSGSLGNIAMAVACYGLFLAEPLPLFRLMAQVQLAVCGYSLLPVEKLDGKKLQSRPRFLFALGLLLSLTGAAFLTGLI